MSLAKVIESYNWWPEFTGKGEILPTNPKHLTDAHAKKLFQKLEDSLSPEHLHCDGEISPAKARAKARTFYAAIKHLEKLGFDSSNYYF